MCSLLRKITYNLGDRAKNLAKYLGEDIQIKEELSLIRVVKVQEDALLEENNWFS